METRFRASYDRTATIATAVVVAIALGTTALLVIGAINSYPRSRAGSCALLIGAVLDLMIPVVAFLLSPRGYAISSSGSVTVLRPGADVVIPAEATASVEYDPSDSVFRKAIRSNASGGAFGFFGRFQSPKLGSFQAFATRTAKVVILRLAKGEPIVLTPDDPERFVASLEGARRS